MTQCHFKRRIFRTREAVAEFTVLNLERNFGEYQQDYPWVRAAHNPVYLFNRPTFAWADLRKFMEYPYVYPD